MDRQPSVYILASRKQGTLYTGVTGNLIKRIWEHRNDLVPGFTHRYNVHVLVYYEIHQAMNDAIYREKCIKGWRRAWKIALIESLNPDWLDLWDALTGMDPGVLRDGNGLGGGG